jgi:hypothetical protein
MGPSRWSMNASAFKSVQIKEGIFLRFNIDFFNVFNMPGTVMPESNPPSTTITANTGIVTNQFSDNSPRVLQVTARLTW